jgi:hypothetical protein
VLNSRIFNQAYTNTNSNGDKVFMTVVYAAWGMPLELHRAIIPSNGQPPSSDMIIEGTNLYNGNPRHIVLFWRKENKIVLFNCGDFIQRNIIIFKIGTSIGSNIVE